MCCVCFVGMNEGFGNVHVMFAVIVCFRVVGVLVCYCEFVGGCMLSFFTGCL